MAQQTIHTLRQWFSKNNRPKHDQFWDWLDSFWHKDEKIPAEIIDGLKEALDTKLSLSEAELIEAKVDDALGQIVILDGGIPPLRADMEQADTALAGGIAKNSEDITALQHNLDNAWESIYASQEDVETAITNTNVACDAANDAAAEATAAAVNANDAAAALPAAIAAKQDKLIAGTGITIAADGRTISSSSGATTIVTYVVDSDAALADWANNAAGNDYSCVLIKAGTWKSAKEVDLTAAGTYVVIGESGNKLEFSSDFGLKYQSMPTSNDFWMQEVIVSITSPLYGASCFRYCTNLMLCTGLGIGSGPNSTYAFEYCSNLTSCTGTCTGADIGSSVAYGFYNCTNLISCSGSGRARAAGMGFAYCTNLASCTSYGSGLSAGYGFRSCTTLTNCIGYGTGGDNNAMSYGFEFCSNLLNCKGTGYGEADGTGNGFSNCTRLANCVGNGSGNIPGSKHGYGFHICTNLTNCTGDGKGWTGLGFFTCTNLTNCAGSGIGPNNSYAFQNCRIMFGCYASAMSTNIMYNNCYMNKTGTSNPVGDTAVGGYNRTTA